jgi:hypothetical protein
LPSTSPSTSVDIISDIDIAFDIAAIAFDIADIAFDIACDIASDISNKGAIISSVNLLKNAIPVEQALELVKIMQSNQKLATLCGLSGKETTLDFSNQGLRSGDALLIANDISDMGALTSLNLADNKIGAHYDSDRHEMVATPEGTRVASYI